MDDTIVWRFIYLVYLHWYDARMAIARKKVGL